MTNKDIEEIIKVICPNDEDFEKPCISPAYLEKELEALALEQEECEDLISKKHLLKTISDLQYNNKNKEQEIGGRDVLNYYIPQIINDEPSAKSSIVHCKDCKKYKRRYFPNGTCYGTVCDWCGFEMKPEDYCSKGERKDADSN